MPNTALNYAAIDRNGDASYEWNIPLWEFNNRQSKNKQNQNYVVKINRKNVWIFVFTILVYKLISLQKVHSFIWYNIFFSILVESIDRKYYIPVEFSPKNYFDITLVLQCIEDTIFKIKH